MKKYKEIIVPIFFIAFIWLIFFICLMEVAVAYLPHLNLHSIESGADLAEESDGRETRAQIFADDSYLYPVCMTYLKVADLIISKQCKLNNDAIVTNVINNKLPTDALGFGYDFKWEVTAYARQKVCEVPDWWMD